MTNSGLLLSTAAFSSLTLAAQKEVLFAIGLSDIGQSSAGASTATALPLTHVEDGPPEMTLALVRKLTDKLSDKTLTALKVIAQSDTPQFHLKDVVDATSGATSYMDVRSVWSALTRRSRKVLNDSDADPIWWDGQKFYDAQGNFVDQILRVSKLTHISLKTHFGF